MIDTKTPVSEIQVRRSLDRAQHRKPLRLWISRRAARTTAGAEKFVTQVRLGKAEAVVIPWAADRATVAS
ncbi:MAG TPA: hypothetical protein VHZ27_21305 [Solirubrobacteraceae bacterium]|jgi:hypothetical protein|nr:hypothetical protein [Solirubrobacteraceae bacterium]